MTQLSPFPSPALAVVIGAGGGIGAALLSALREAGRFEDVIGLSRRGDPPLDLLDERSIRAAAERIAGHRAPPRLILDATGFLHDGDYRPEKSWRQLDPDHLARAFAVNATGPALLMKHLLPLLPRDGKAVFATLSARVGSISDNRIGGWYAYRASKAALNQLVRCAAIELRRTHPQAVCVALHPGTVDTGLSAPFAKAGLEVRPPEVAAADLLAVVDGLTPERSGELVDQNGETVPF
ncbi:MULTISPECIES: SDR family oxidoreductase [Thalassobaculum]|uniref:NAD(P)-dependent dehydrogenase, short-chain alcohol dehydrogenase family n=1 Tax=Thalassobaculum litoreum DSM 18839 TaxID=1123362 RepID=A0A8G2BKE2_9PROT|nr:MULTISPECIES: SDR family NAD(P)-dependent oxidoreductase [Thalassobaculum]SDF87354.1 NAD(P)-dependent dehydrogenase, short-chain alcohol dehydrogenase family [Thalassobaculum litoreum DSM 18839]